MTLNEVGERLAPPNERGCREWMGARNGDGYGSVWLENRAMSAHRAMWTLVHGAIPSGMCVLHHCDNPPCCELSHLFLGTNADNVADRDRKQRRQAPRGEANGRSKLTRADVAEIRRRYAAGGIQKVQLAAEYGVTETNIRLIIAGRAWTFDFDEE